MTRDIEIGLTLMECHELQNGNSEIYLRYLEEQAAEIIRRDGTHSDPLRVPASELLRGGGFDVAFGNIEISVSLLLGAELFMASGTCAADDHDGALGILIKHGDDLFGLLGAKFGFADLLGDQPMELPEAVTSETVSVLFWANYFGRAYIDRHGIEYFRAAPFFSIDERSGGSLLCRTRRTPFEEMDPERERALVQYFGGPDRCQIYRASEYPIDL